MSDYKRILTDYDTKQSLYNKFCAEVSMICEKLLLNQMISLHSVTGRVKDIKSLEKKIKKENKTYKQLEDITDLAGIRIITYFSSDVDTVANIIEKEFVIDKKNSIDKRSVIEADRFGYLSLHYVVQLKNKEKYPDFYQLRAEIQIRSILQHAWAEIEHDLGYKTEEKLPRDIRRSFSRVAGLLETADEEFMVIRDRLNNYELELIRQIKKAPESVELTKKSLELALANDEILLSFFEILSSEKASDVNTEELTFILKAMKYVNIRTVGDLIGVISQYKEELAKLHELYEYNFQHSIEVVALYLTGKTNSENYISEYLQTFLAFRKETIEEEARKLTLVIEALDLEK